MGEARVKGIGYPMIFWHWVWYLMHPWQWHQPDYDDDGYCRGCD